MSDQPVITVGGMEIPASKQHIEQAMDRCKKLIDKGFQVEHYTKLLHEYRAALRALKKPKSVSREVRREIRDEYAEVVRKRRHLQTGWAKRLGFDADNDVPHDDTYYLMAQKERPRTRGDCQHSYRPCPFIGCKYNLWMDVRYFKQRKDPNKAPPIKPNYPEIPPWNMKPSRSCVLDIAEEGGLTLEEIGELLTVTRERIRQVEVIALTALRKILDPTLREDLAILDKVTTWGIMQDETH